ncbi:MAG: hypothetical protein HN337_01710, partial [Deltaproteobacteria bacterium]|nr:hypothetical protein [Deltaproteobacteria bacterium]
RQPFHSAYPLARGLSEAPRITSWLQSSYYSFLKAAAADLTVYQYRRVYDGKKLAIDLSVDPGKNEVVVYVMRKGREGSLATLISDSSGKLTAVSDCDLKPAGFTREYVAYLYREDPNLPMRKALVDAFKIPSVNRKVPDYIVKAEEVISKRQRAMEAIKPTKTRLRKIIKDPVDAVEALQHEYALLRYRDGKPRYIQTADAGPCVVMTLYDAATNVGAIAHFDAGTDIGQTFHMFKRDVKATGGDLSNMEARLVGGFRGMSEGLILDLKDGLRDNGVKIVEEDVLAEPSPEGSVAITLDLMTGEIYDYSETYLGPDRAGRVEESLQQMDTPLKPVSR